MKTILISVLGSFFIFISSIANADTLSGNNLLEMMQSKEWADKKGALFYILGVMNAKEIQAYKDNLRVAKDSKLDEPPFCVPETSNNGQIFDIVKKYLLDNPAVRHEPALPIVQIALEKAFHCH